MAISSIKPNLQWGMGWGLGMAVCYSVIALGLGLVRGGLHVDDGRLSTGRIIMFYFGGGVAGGLVLGLLRPFTRTRLGAAIVGVFVSFPLIYMVGTSLYGSRGRVLLATTILSLIMGPAFALRVWEPPEDESQPYR